MADQQIFFGKGKLLLTSEYAVLDGAKALALPTKLGQQLIVTTNLYQEASMLIWKAIDHQGQIWFEAQLSPHNFHIIESTDKSIAIALQTILRAAQELRPFVLSSRIIKVTTELDFPIDWGLGSSSSLIYVIAQWAKIDPFDLLQETFKGSGYDIACASAERPIIYTIKDKKPTWQEIDFNPSFKNQLYFVYLGKKQNSRTGIKWYRDKVNNATALVNKCSSITNAILQTNDLSTFEQLLLEHEHLIAQTLDLPRAQDLYFSDYLGVIKSLGAWGGDFVLATSTRSKDATKNYFQQKGFDVVLNYQELIG